jgi:hypothetical protein
MTQPAFLGPPFCSQMTPRGGPDLIFAGALHRLRPAVATGSSENGAAAHIFTNNNALKRIDKLV